MERIAQCHCGQVKITCQGDPEIVFMCSCQLCQRRTGSPVHIGAWFDREKVKIEGKTNEYVRTGDRGTESKFRFCPNCGTSIWWGDNTEGFMAGRIGIAGGCFADRDFPPPDFAVYDKRRPPWITVPREAACFMEIPPPEIVAKWVGAKD